MTISQNSTLPCAVKNKPPAHTNTPTSRILEENFYYLHKGKQAFIEIDNSKWS